MSSISTPAVAPPSKDWVNEQRRKAAGGGPPRPIPATAPLPAPCPDPPTMEMAFTSSGAIAPWAVAWARTQNGLYTRPLYHFEPTFWTNQYDGTPGCPCPTLCPSFCGLV